MAGQIESEREGMPPNVFKYTAINSRLLCRVLDVRHGIGRCPAEIRGCCAARRRFLMATKDPTDKSEEAHAAIQPSLSVASCDSHRASSSSASWFSSSSPSTSSTSNSSLFFEGASTVSLNSCGSEATSDVAAATGQPVPCATEANKSTKVRMGQTDNSP